MLKLTAVGIDVERIPMATASDASSRAEIMKLAEQRAVSAAPFLSKTYFGDTPWDLQASRALGYSFVGVGSSVEHTVVYRDLADQDSILSMLGV